MSDINISIGDSGDINLALDGISTFQALTDTPSSYSGQSGKVATVNVGETALEFTSSAGDVTGPSSAVDENITVFDSTTGKLIKDSGVNVSEVTANTAKVTNATHTGDVTGATTLTIGTDKVLDSHINWGTGATQVNTADIPELTNLYYTEARVSANTDVASNTAHKTSNGTDHTYINQDVASSASPTFGGLTVVNAINEFSTDGTLGGNSDSAIPTEQAVKTYADGLLGANDAMTYKGVINCSANPDYPAADAGDTYKVSVAGKIGGASGENVEVGDMAICLVDSTASGDQATVGANWNIIQVNIDGAVVGPASSTDEALARFDSTTGKIIKNSSVTVSDAGLIAGATNTNWDAAYSHISNTSNPHSVDASDVSLGNVTNVATDDTAYNATSWNANTDSATKNAIRDKIETMDTAIGLNTAKDTNVSTDLSLGTITSTTMDVNSSDGTNSTLIAADTDDAGLLTAAKFDEIVANNAKVTNVTTNLSEGTSTETTVDINSSDGTNATLVSASTSRAGLLTKAKFDEIVANNAKDTNVTTNLSLGAIDGTTMVVASSDGTDATLISADTDDAGLLTAAKFDEIVANTAKDTNVSTDLSAGTLTATTIDVNSSDGTNATLVEADTTNAGILGSDKWDEIVANTSAKHTQGSDTTLGTMTQDINMNSSYQVVGLQAPAASGEAIRQTTNVTETNLNTLTGGGDTTLHDHDGISENTAARHTQGTDTTINSSVGSGIVKTAAGTLSSVAAPTGTIVGTSDTQDLTNKTFTDNVDFKGTFTAGESVVDGDLCYYKSDSKFWKVDADAEATSKGRLAIAKATISADASGVFLLKGEHTTTGLTAADELFISATAGEWTNTKPSTATQVVRLIGYSVSTTVLFFDPDKTYIEVA